MSTLLTALAALSFGTLDAHAVANPSSLTMNLYAAWISPNADCSSPVNLFDGGSTSMPFDMIRNPTLGGGNPPDGTYKCIIMKLSSMVTFIPAASDGLCTAAASYTDSICKTGESTIPYNGSSFGASVACTGTSTSPADNTIFLYLSTTSTSDGRNGGGGGNPFAQPIATTDGLKLAAPFVVNGSSAGTFVVDGTGKIDGSGTKCKMQAPIFSFR